jgi:transcription elongation factor
VYIETRQPHKVYKVLQLIPGVLFNPSGSIFQYIDFEDGLKLLNMRQTGVGNWVRILKGNYKGDVGFVLSTETWGVRVLLIPRLPPSAAISHSASCTTSRPTPCLFGRDPLIEQEQESPCENICSFEDKIFEHGLIRKNYAFQSVSTTVSSMPFETFCLFWASQHPKLVASKSSFLRPAEWHFAEGDEVQFCDQAQSSYDPPKSGRITIIRSDSVDLVSEGGVNTVGWLDLEKVIRQGDFVEITGGRYEGETGWVDNVTEKVARVVRLTENSRERIEVCGI